MFNYLKTDSGKVTIKILATILVMTLTFANFILLGSYLGKGNVSYATDDTSTNNNNVKFGVYLDETKTKNTVTADFNSQDLKLYVYVAVENQGTLENAKITLEDTNFNLKAKEEQTEINLGTINAGSVKNEVYEIVPKKYVSFNLDLLNKQSKIKLTGTYKGSNKSNVTEEEINSIKTVTINLDAPKLINNADNENYKAELNSEIITNEVYSIDSIEGTKANKRVVQQYVSSKIVNNSYPIKSTNIEITVPMLGETAPEDVNIATYGTAATNGKYFDFGEKSENKAGQWEYDNENKKIIINVENKADENNNVSWEKDVEDTFVITYVYPETATTNKITSNITSKIAVFTCNEAEELIEAEPVTVETKNFDNIALDPTLDITAQQSIYKGNMKIEKPTSFRTAWTVGVSYAKLTDSITLTNQSDDNLKLEDGFNSEAGIEATTTFKYTYINKEEMTQILGENGTAKIIAITNTDMPSEIAIISKDTPTEKLGNQDYYKVEYPADSNIETILIKTTKPVKEGILSIINDKELVSNNDVKANLDKISTLTTSAALALLQGENVAASSQASFEIKFLNTENSATIEANKTNLSTTEDNQVDFTVTLNENNSKYELYKNPTIKIELPSYVTEATIQEVQLLNENGLTIKNKTVNGKIITIELEGETLGYNIEQNPQLIVKTTLTTNNLIPTTEGKAKLTVTNENNQTPTTAETTLTAEAAQGILTATTVTAYNGNNPALTSFKTDLKTGTLATETEKGVKPHIVGTVINNTSSDLTNITVIGKMSGENSNIGAVISNVTGGTISYTADEDVKLDSNWTSEIPANATGYKIVIESLESKETAEFAYDLQLPANLEINKSMDITYKVINGTNEVKAPSVILQTPQETKLELKVTPTAENNTVVYEGQKLTYNVTVKNTGNNTVKNINVSNTVPEGTTLVSGSSSAWTIGALEAGKEITKTMEVTVNNLAEGETTKDITVTTTVEQAYLEQNLTNTIKNTVNKALISVEIKDGYGINNVETLYERVPIAYKTLISNNSEQELNNVKVVAYIPDNMEFVTDSIIVLKSVSEGMSDENNAIDKNVNKKIESNRIEYTIDELPANYTIELYSELIGNLPDEIYEAQIQYKVAVQSTQMEQQYVQAKNNILIKPNINCEQTLKNLTDNTRINNVNIGDELEYSIIINNNGNYPQPINFDTKFSDELSFENIVYKNSNNDECKVEDLEVNSYHVEETISPKSSLKIKIKAKVEDSENNEVKCNSTCNEVFVSNAGTIHNVITKVGDFETKSIINRMPTDPSNPDNPTNPDDPTPVDPTSTYTLSGKAWLDENKDGKLGSEEQLLKDILVTIKDATTGEFLKDKDNNLITAKTDNKGEYQFKDLKPGKYILVFECDTKTYGVTVTSGDSIAVATTEDGKTVIKTDTLELKNKDITNLNIGLIKNPKFDLQLDKYVSKITVQNVDGTTTYNYDKSQLAKLEISSKKMVGSVVVVEYTIDVTNKGEVVGYAKTLVDYVSKEYNFASELNTSWYQGTDNNLYCAELAEEIINPGETKSVKLVLTKTMTATNTGLISNTAEIEEDFNEFALSDVNSTPGNNEQKENDMSGADVLVSVKTGGVMLYIGIIIASMLILRWRNLLSK